MTFTERFMKECGRDNVLQAIADPEAWRAVGKANNWDVLQSNTHGFTTPDGKVAVVPSWKFRFHLFIGLMTEHGFTIEKALEIAYTPEV